MFQKTQITILLPNIDIDTCGVFLFEEDMLR